VKRALVLAAVVASLLGIVIACSTSPVVVGTFDCVISDAGDSTHVCPDGYFCETETASCGATFGHCKLIDSPGCALTEPQCGCDKITYYNECAREEAHAGLAIPGPCGVAQAMGCIRAEQCPGKNRACSYVLPFNPFRLIDAGLGDGGPTFCPDAVPGGICWSLPEDGTPPSGRQVSTACGQCKDDLLAIRGIGGFLYACASPDASAD
jgi:hypothetical protein